MQFYKINVNRVVHYYVREMLFIFKLISSFQYKDQSIKILAIVNNQIIGKTNIKPITFDIY